MAAQRRCCVCQCTDARACLVAGLPCAWVYEDLCSACAPLIVTLAKQPDWTIEAVNRLRREDGRPPLSQGEVFVRVLAMDVVYRRRIRGR